VRDIEGKSVRDEMSMCFGVWVRVVNVGWVHILSVSWIHIESTDLVALRVWCVRLR
jgi:hypothetical protein